MKLTRKTPLKRKSKVKKVRNIKMATLWSNFSKMIRLRDCLATTGTPNFCICCTCGARVEDANRQLHAGHWHPQRRNSVKYCEANCHGQCATCNTGLGGNPREYAKFMEAHYGQGVMDWISWTSNNVIWTIKPWEVRELNQHFVNEIARMKSEYAEGKYTQEGL